MDSAGDTQAIMVVRELPPRLSYKIRVSFELRYGMNYLPAAAFFSSVRAAMTLPSASRPWLIWMPSLSVLPVAPVFLMRSEPAKSTKWNLAEMFSSLVTGSSPCAASPSAGYVTLTIFCSIVTVKMACERDDCSFISVELVMRCAMPLLSS